MLNSAVVLEVRRWRRGVGKSFSSNSVPLGAGTGKTFTTGPSGKVTPQETPKQTTPSPSSSGSSSGSPVLRVI